MFLASQGEKNQGSQRIWIKCINAGLYRWMVGLMKRKVSNQERFQICYLIKNYSASGFDLPSIRKSNSCKILSPVLLLPPFLFPTSHTWPQISLRFLTPGSSSQIVRNSIQHKAAILFHRYYMILHQHSRFPTTSLCHSWGC